MREGGDPRDSSVSEGPEGWRYIGGGIIVARYTTVQRFGFVVTTTRHDVAWAKRSTTLQRVSRSRTFSDAGSPRVAAPSPRDWGPLR